MTDSPVKYAARDCVFMIADTSGETVTWTEIGGIETFTPSRSSKSTDITDFASQGESQQLIMERTKTLKLEGTRLQDQTSGALDPGQALVEALADAVGQDSLGQIRFASPGDVDYEVWEATAELGDGGGDQNAMYAWSVTFTRSGPSTTVAKS